MEKVFKVNDLTIEDCAYHMDRYKLRMFRGTEEEFVMFYTDKIGYPPEEDYVVYTDPEQVSKVEHGKHDGNIVGYRSKSTREKESIYASKVYLASKFN